MPLASYNLTIIDYNGETSRMGVNVGAVTAVSLPGLLTNIATFRGATSALILGNQKSDTLTAFKSNLTNALPTDPNAQVERKWLVTYADNQPFFDAPVNAIPNEGFGKTFTLEIATANAELLTDNSEFLDINAGDGSDWADAFEAMARSAYGGTVIVQSIELVGRTR
jgi:hypothetical protein